MSSARSWRELPLERGRGSLLAGLEGEQALPTSSTDPKSFGVSTLRCTIEKWISIWFSHEAWTGRWTGWRFGH